MRISVIGTGYLGATHAAALASLGHEVLGIDADERRIEPLAQGRAPFHEPHLDELLREGVRAGRLAFDTDYERAADFAEVHFLCVGTPQQADGDAADLSHLWGAADTLAPLLRRESLVVGKSTVPVGTAERLASHVQDRSPARTDVCLAWNPEFLREGHAVEDSLRPDRLVFGVRTDRDYERLRSVYAALLASGIPALRTDLATAELAKVAANVMLATRVSLVNLLAEVCEVADADVADLTAILGRDPRIGNRFLTPGIGFGGGCLPKDLRAFVARAEELGVTESVSLLREVDAVNVRQRSRAVELTLRLLGGRPDRSTADHRVAVLGAAFKAGSDDIRDSPALDVANRVAARGPRVRVYDPKAGHHVRATAPQLEVADDIEQACAGATVTLVLTEWDEFRALDPVSLRDTVADPTIIDGRLALDPDKWVAAGWDFHALGRGGSSNADPVVARARFVDDGVRPGTA